MAVGCHTVYLPGCFSYVCRTTCNLLLEFQLIVYSHVEQFSKWTYLFSLICLPTLFMKGLFFSFLFYQSSDCLGGKRFNEALKDFCTILFADLNREVVRLPILPNVLLWCSLIVTSMTKFNNNKQKETLHLAASVMFMSWISTFCGFSAFHAFSHGAKFPNWILLLTIIHFWDHILEGNCIGRGSVIGKGLLVPN